MMLIAVLVVLEFLQKFKEFEDDVGRVVMCITCRRPSVHASRAGCSLVTANPPVATVPPRVVAASR